MANLTTLAVLKEDNVLERVKEKGQKLAQTLASMAEKT